MLEKGGAALSEAEAELYDRQIRLWGLDAQKRLRAAKVLVAGVKGFTVEVAKNLVLAGVAALKLLDHKPLSAADAQVNYLAPRDRVGSNRAEASLERLQALNPMVAVTAEAADLGQKGEDFFANFDVVVVASYPKDIKQRVNDFCRRRGANFFCGDVYGCFGYSFMDLIDHEYVEETVVRPPKEEPDDADKAGEPAAKKARVEDVETTAMVKKRMEFVPLEKTLQVDWADEKLARRVRRMNPALFILHVIFEFHSREGRSPHDEKDLELLTALRSSVLSKFSLPESKVPESALPLLVARESAPVAAIVGGKLAQEIIKVISNKDAPHLNYFLFNPLDGAGVVEPVGVAA